jgi:ABC-type cobalamin/Fe3+-siderophores transport system ATPase subunit
MSYKTKETELTKTLKPIDNQLELNDNTIFNRKHWHYLIVGKRGSGKSTLLLNLLSTPKKEGGLMKEFDTIYLVSSTAQKDEKFDQLVEELERGKTFYPEFSNEVMEEIMADMEKKISTKKKTPHFLVILDDVIESLPLNRKKGQAFNKFLISSRHFKSSMILLSQRLNQLSPLVRSQTDIVSYYRSDNKKEDKTFMETYSVPEDMLKFCVNSEPHSFITVSFTTGKPKYFCKFDEIEKE